MKGILTLLTLTFMVSGALAAPEQDAKKDSREAMLLQVLRDLTKEVAGLRSEISGMRKGGGADTQAKKATEATVRKNRAAATYKAMEDQAKRALLKVRDEKAALYARVEEANRLRAEAGHLQAYVSRLNTQKSELETTVAKARADADARHERMARKEYELREELKKTRAERDDLRSRVHGLTAQVEKFQTMLASMQSQVAEMAQLMKKLTHGK